MSLRTSAHTGVAISIGFRPVREIATSPSAPRNDTVWGGRVLLPHLCRGGFSTLPIARRANRNNERPQAVAKPETLRRIRTAVTPPSAATPHQSAALTASPQGEAFAAPPLRGCRRGGFSTLPSARKGAPQKRHGVTPCPTIPPNNNHCHCHVAALLAMTVVFGGLPCWTGGVCFRRFWEGQDPPLHGTGATKSAHLHGCNAA